MEKTNNSYTIAEIEAFFPELFQGMIKVDSRKALYRLQNGKIIYFQTSKVHDYQSYGATWQAIKWDTFNQIDLYCQIIGFEGIVLMSKEILSNYSQVSPSIKSDKFYIQFKIWPGLSFIVGKGKQLNQNLRDYFYDIPVNESQVMDNIMEESLEETIARALEFKDYEIQYQDGFEKIHRRIESKAQKERVAKIENHTCQICGFRYEYKTKDRVSRWIIEVDHIQEKSAGGGETIDNLLVLCPNCHTKKTYGAITINPDYTYSEDGIIKPLLCNNHLGILKPKKHNTKKQD